jgi:hypothetical protein
MKALVVLSVVECLVLGKEAVGGSSGRLEGGEEVAPCQRRVEKDMWRRSWCG